MMIQIRRILCPTDFSEPARQAQQYAMTLAERFASELHLLHIVPYVTIPLPDASTSWTLPVSEQNQQVEDALAMLQQAIGSTWAKDHRVKLNSHVGNEVEEIVKYATDHEIDLIVLGTHGYRGFTHFIIGSVAEKVVRMATCPVLTVHPKGHQFVCDASSGQDASAPVS